jgi:hypothetical protein
VVGATAGAAAGTIRKWQKLFDEDDRSDGAGTRLHLEKVQEQLQPLFRI